MQAPGFWDDQKVAARTSSEHASLSQRITDYRDLTGELVDAGDLLDMARDEARMKAQLQAAAFGVDAAAMGVAPDSAPSPDPVTA